MNPRTVVLDWWRNYVPVVPAEIEFECKQGEDALLDLTKYLVQGARDFDTNESPSDGVLDKVSVQRGWRCRPLLLNTPDTALVTQVPTGFKIKCAEAGTQCFNFRLTNGTQMSDVVKVLLQVSAWYSVSVTVYRKTADEYVFVAAPTFPKELRQPFSYTFHWYWDHKVMVTDTVVKTSRVVDTETLLQESTVIDQYPQFMPVIVKKPKLDYVFTTDTNLSGLDGNSSRVYQPTGTRGKLRLVCRLYFDAYHNSGISRLDMSKYTEIEYVTPDNWWLRGDIQPI